MKFKSFVGMDHSPLGAAYFANTQAEDFLKVTPDPDGGSLLRTLHQMSTTSTDFCEPDGTQWYTYTLTLAYTEMTYRHVDVESGTFKTFPLPEEVR